MASVAPRQLSLPHDPLALPDDVLESPNLRSASIADGTVPNRAVIGRVNTPAHVAREMARLAVTALASAGRLSDPVIIEPAAGSGVIVGALVEALSQNARFTLNEPRALARAAARTTFRLSKPHPLAALGCIHAIDADPKVKKAAGRRLAMSIGTPPTAWLGRQYRIGDTLLDPSLLPRRLIDLIIGNPPYLGLRHARRLPQFDRWKEEYGVAEDLYALFIRWALRTVRPGGHVLLLVPDTWLSLSSYENLRRGILNGRLKRIIRLPSDTFAGHVYPCYFLWQKSKHRSSSVMFTDARPTETDTKRRSYKAAQSVFASAPAARLFTPTRRSRELAHFFGALDRCDGRVKTLGDIARVADVGIHSRNCRHRLFYARRDRPGLQRLLQGRQIERFAVFWNAPRAQYHWVNIDYRPNPHTPGRRGNGRLSVRGEYWDWQGDPSIHRLPERILIRQTGDRIVAARCVQRHRHYYTDNTLFTATLTDRARDDGITYSYLLAWLNSAIASELYRFLSDERGRAQAQIKIKLLRRLPFVIPARRSIVAIDRLAQEIESARLRGAEMRAGEKTIDKHFARLFARATSGMLHRSAKTPPDRITRNAPLL